METPPTSWEQKQRMRREAHAARDQLADRAALSAAIAARCVALPEYVAAGTVMAYLNARSEVATDDLLADLRARGRRIVIPYCVGDDLRLFLLESPEELALGTFGIREPRRELRGAVGKEVPPGLIDLVFVPGVAFDRQGGRLGHGKGYYDRLLRQLRDNCPRVGVAFECQLFPKVPMMDHDVPLDAIVTEAAVYRRAAGP